MKCMSCGLTQALSSVYDVEMNPLCPSCAKPFVRLEVADVLLRGHGGLVTSPRIPQVDMASAIEAALTAPAIPQQTVLVEAPVGTGKSYGYGVPAILANTPRVVITTAKKALQHQLFEKDIPRIREALKLDFKFALMKGKRNYGCLQKIDDFKPSAQQKSEGLPDELKQLRDHVFVNADLSTYTERLPEVANHLTAEDCMRRKCPAYDQCNYIKVRQLGKEAKVLIANHHVAAIDIRLGAGTIFGPYTTLVVDEAHQFEKALRSAYEVSAHQNSMISVMNLADHHTGYGDIMNAIKQDWERMFAGRFYEGAVNPNPFGDPGRDVNERLTDMLGAVRYELRLAGYTYADDVDRQIRTFRPKTPALQNHSGFAGLVEKNRVHLNVPTMHGMVTLESRLEKLQEFLSTLAEPGDNTIICFERMGTHRVPSFRATPIEIADYAGPRLALIERKIFTSGTLAIGGSCIPFAKRLGLTSTYAPPPLPPEAPPELVKQREALIKAPVVTEKVLPSPFNYKKQQLMYLPRDLPFPVTASATPTPERAAYIKALATRITSLIQLAGGNTFVLFTARSDLKEVHTAIQVADQLEQPIIVHEEGQDAALALRDYMSTPKSTLFGLKTFWEGIDIVGSKLSQVIISKLPFPSPGDPVLKAREEKMKARMLEDGCTDAEIRGAVFARLFKDAMLEDVRQGAGRLIRSTTDRGVLAILDTRMYTGKSGGDPLRASVERLPGYGGEVHRAVGGSTVTAELGVLQAWFKIAAREERERQR